MSSLPRPLRGLATKDAVGVGGCVLAAWALTALAAVADDPTVSVASLVIALAGLVVVLRGLEWTANVVMVLGMLFAPMNSVRAGGFVTATDLLFVFGFAMLAPVVARRRLRVSQLFVVAWVVMFTCGLVASVAADNVTLSINHLARFLAAAFVLPLAFMLWRPHRRIVVVMAAAFMVGAAVSVCWGVVQGPVGDRPVGLTTHPNFLGLASAVGVALAPYVLRYTPPAYRWCIVLVTLVDAYGVWISGSRAAFLALVVLVLLVTLLEGSVLLAGALTLGAAGVLLMRDRLIALGGENALTRMLGGGSSTGADFERRQAFERAMDAFHEHPILGNGFEHAMEAHSIYLQVLVSIGVVGLLGYLLLFAAMLSPMLDLRRANYALAYPALVYALVGAFTNSLWDRFVWAALALSLVGVVLDNHRPAPTRSDQPAPVGATS